MGAVTLIPMHVVLTIAEIVVFGLAAGSLAIVVADRSLRRIVPWVWTGSVGALGLFAAAIGFLAATSRSALSVFAAGIGLVIVAAFLRARPGFLRKRGLPPGSMSLVSSLKALAHRDFYANRANRQGPIFKMAQYHHRVICVVGLERGHRLLRERATSIAASPLPFTQEIAGGFLRYMDAETHRVYAPLFRRALAKSVVAAAAPTTRAAADRELQRLAADSSAGAVAPGPFLERIVFESFMRVLFGMEIGTESYDRFASAYQALADQPLSSPLGEAARAAVTSLRAMLLEQSERLRTNSGPLCTLSELGRADPSMPDDVCLDNILFVLRLSTANVESLLHWLLDTVGRHPAWVGPMRDELATDRGGGADLFDRVIAETLRLGQSEYLFRTITEDFEFEGFRFPRGWQMRVCVWESHRDASTFTEPAQFCPERFGERDFSRSEYSPFGWGQHACNGVALTSMICRAVLEGLVSGFEVEVTGGEPAEHGSRHWNHWRPNAALRLRLAAR